MSGLTDSFQSSHGGGSRGERLDATLADLLRAAADIEAAAVVSFDGLPMASALPAGMDEDRVAAMSAALLSLGERAAQGLGRGDLSQVYVEGENGTVFLVSADDEAVLVAVAAGGAKAGLMLYEVRRAAAKVAVVLRQDDVAAVVEPPASAEPLDPITPELAGVGDLGGLPSYATADLPAQPVAAPAEHSWQAYAPNGTVLPGESTWA